MPRNIWHEYLIKRRLAGVAAKKLPWSWISPTCPEIPGGMLERIN
jgi:hypothetical protein